MLLTKKCRQIFPLENVAFWPILQIKEQPSVYKDIWCIELNENVIFVILEAPRAELKSTQRVQSP